MSSARLEQATLNAREAYRALFHVKTLVDSAANTVRDAERNTAGLAISHDRKAGVSDARIKIETAVAGLLTARR